MSSNKNKLIFVAPTLSSFVKNDIEILSGDYKVKPNIYDWNKKFLIPFYLIHQFFFLLTNLPSTTKVLISFGGFWSYLPAVIGKLFGKPVYIILNGTDCAWVPELNYGFLGRFPLKYLCKVSYKKAKLLLPVSKSLVSTTNNFIAGQSQKQGYQVFLPNIKTPYKVVANGLNSVFWTGHVESEKEPKSFTAVFSGNKQFLLKGGDLINDLAKEFSDCKFYFFGLDKDSLDVDFGENVVLNGKVGQEILRVYFHKSQFHFQLSSFEGFGLALCEAMLCESIPIVSSVNALPEIIGDSGFVVEKREIAALKKQVLNALNSPDKEKLSQLARKRIEENYSLVRRKKELLEALTES